MIFDVLTPFQLFKAILIKINRPAKENYID
jgi:hypothetical protein